ncbi:MAG: hypothetical protein M1822_000739 [Bathelium mastoideum]|nr:MAG: hypothetical protein M1822_000739 [Bathelium mastoideum]
MSKQSPAKRPDLSSANDGNQGTPSPARTAHGAHMQAQSTLPSSSQAQRGDASSERHLTLPPLSRASSMTDDISDQSRQGRAIGVHSILNPLQAEVQETRGVRRKADEIESSSSAEHASTRHESVTSVLPSRSASGDVSPAGSQVGYNTFPGLPPRRMLSPRSQVPRLASLSTLRQPTGTLPVQDNPFLSSAGPASAVESSSSGLPLPTPPAAMLQGYNFPAAPTPPIPESRRASGALAIPIHSSSASPSTQVSSFSQASRNSPALQLSIPVEQARAGFYTPPVQTPGPHMIDRERPQGIPVSSTGHSSYQLMTFNTASGAAVQFPVDVQAASRAADDKRRRNAGASARFRARRKEKEREASTTISRLEQQLKDAKEDADFYRRERDYLGAALLQLQGGDHHFPRPASPRQRRDHGSSESGSGSGSYASPFQSQRQPSVPLREQGPGSAGYSPTASAPPTALPRGAYQSAYPPLQDAARQPARVTRSVPPGSQPLPPTQQQPPQQQQPLPRVAPPGPQKTSSYDTYGAEGYDRSWPSGPRNGGR